jgi:hypothetical protein
METKSKENDIKIEILIDELESDILIVGATSI